MAISRHYLKTEKKKNQQFFLMLYLYLLDTIGFSFSDTQSGLPIENSKNIKTFKISEEDKYKIIKNRCTKKIYQLL